MEGQVMLKQEKTYSAVRELIERYPDTSIMEAIRQVAKRGRENVGTVQAAYYRQDKVEKRRLRTRPTQTEILAKLQPIHHVGVGSAKSVPAANGDLRHAAATALREYEEHLMNREASVTNREAAVEKREQQLDELRAKIATLV